MNSVQVIRVPYTLKELKADKISKSKLEKICQSDLGPDQPAQCMSARFIGKDDETLLVYFGRRVLQEGMEPPVCLNFIIHRIGLTLFLKKPITLTEQYIERTVEDYDNALNQMGAQPIFDGLHVGFYFSIISKHHSHFGLAK